MNLKGKNFLKMLDFTPEEIEGMIDLALCGHYNKSIPHKTEKLAAPPPTEGDWIWI